MKTLYYLTILAVFTGTVFTPTPSTATRPARSVLSSKIPSRYIVRFTGSVGHEERNELKKAGARILEAVPPSGYLIECDSAFEIPKDAELEALTPAHKLSRELGDLVEGKERPGGPIYLRAVTYRNRSARDAASAIDHLVEPHARLDWHDDGSGRGMVWVRVSERAAAELALELALHPDVMWVERYVLPVLLNDDSTWLMQSDSESEGRTVFRKGLTGFGQVVGVADSGLDADACQFRYGPEPEAVTTAVIFPQPPVAIKSKPDNKVISYYVVGQAEPYDDATGGFHGTHTVGDIAGDNYEHLATASAAGHDPQDGMAPGAQIVFQDIGANDGILKGLMGKSMFDLLDQAYRTGARVHNNSYGSAVIDVDYDSDSASIDDAMWRFNDLLVVFAAGNSGADRNGNIIPRSLGGTGSTAKNTLVVGASGPVKLNLYGSMLYLEDDLVFFSSQGPTADDRIKPDVVAPGLVFSATTDTGTLVDEGCCDVNDNNKLVTSNTDGNCNVDEEWPTMGTSFSSPLTAGAATLVRQYFTDGFWLAGESSPADGFNPTNALVKATIVNGATPLTGVIIGISGSHPLTYPPSFAQGWGRVKLEDSLYFDGDERVTLVLNDTPNPVPENPMLAEDAALAPFSGEAPLETGDEHSWILPDCKSSGLLKVTLAWTDPPAAPGAQVALVNDLDLEVEAPGNDRYLGNREFDDEGHSLPASSSETDERNNLEQVIISEPEAGSHRVTVSGTSIPGNGDEGSESQGYALVASCEFLPPIPSGIDPAIGVPNSGLSDVKVTGDNFIAGMELDLGPGISAEGVEVIDGQNAVIGTLLVAESAKLGPRDVTASVYGTLRGVAQGLFEVSNSPDGSGSGCGCHVSGAGQPFVALVLGLFLTCLSLTRRRFRR